MGAALAKTQKGAMEMTDETRVIRWPWMADIPAGSEKLAEFRRIVATVAAPDGVEMLRSQAFSASKDQIVRARETVWNTVAGHWDCGTAAMLTSELVENSIAHSGSHFFGLNIARTADGLLLTSVVDEGCNGFPHLLPNLSGPARGRGLRLVDALAVRWGVVRGARAGAAVWFEIGCRPVVPPAGRWRRLR